MSTELSFKSSNQKSTAILLLAILVLAFAFGTSMDFLQNDHTVYAKPGETISIKWETVMDEGYFVQYQPTPYEIRARYSWISDDETISSKTLASNEHLSGTLKVKMPTTPGTYTVRISEHLRVPPNNTNYWTGSGKFTVNVIVTDDIPAGNNNSTGNNTDNEIPITIEKTLLKLVVCAVVIGCLGILYFYVKRKERLKNE
ncbi:hypothetical protein [Methanolapillus millepedarum]|uniref:Uncharacterized protein n=1 Tax=Methanolapillus millepedarum TaxID=3028296 RepID=A0AA96ZVR9_9EURY|nr:hypothetical protein MsAc7_06890 [Methanosarcinaceae archaeon Ac7]